MEKKKFSTVISYDDETNKLILKYQKAVKEKFGAKPRKEIVIAEMIEHGKKFIIEQTKKLKQ